MPVLRNERHEKVAQGIAKGLNGVEAYRAAYQVASNKVAGAAVSRLTARTDVKERIDELVGRRNVDTAIRQMDIAKTIGRPPIYLPEMDDMARRLALLGISEPAIAETLLVDEATLTQWKARYPSFHKALNRGRLAADAKVAESLYHRALGYRAPATKIMQYEGQVITQDYVQHHAPETAAASFWLRNRQPELWRDRREVETRTPTDTLREKVMSMSREERRAWMADVAERYRLTTGRVIEHDEPEPEAK